MTSISSSAPVDSISGANFSLIVAVEPWNEQASIDGDWSFSIGDQKFSMSSIGGGSLTRAPRTR